jgi:hypothetical protein
LPTEQAFGRRIQTVLAQRGEMWLWEPVTTLATEYPASLPEARVGLAKRIFFDMHRQGMIKFWVADAWPPTSSAPLPDTQVDLLRDDDDLWKDPASASLIVAVRPAGALPGTNVPPAPPPTIPPGGFQL